MNFVKNKFQTRIPSAELTVYLTRSIFATPAGIEISVRIMGISLLIKIPAAPFSLTQASIYWFSPVITMPVLFFLQFVFISKECAPPGHKKRASRRHPEIHDTRQAALFSFYFIMVSTICAVSTMFVPLSILHF